MQIRCAPALRRPESRLQLIWVGPDVCRLLANNLGCLQINVGSRRRILSVNLGRKSGCLQAEAPMFAGRYTYVGGVLESLQVFYRLYPAAPAKKTTPARAVAPGKKAAPAARKNALRKASPARTRKKSATKKTG
jgi:hypothetical protein